MAGNYDQCFFLPPQRIDQGELSDLIECLESLRLGFPNESDNECCPRCSVVTFMVHYKTEGDQILAMSGSIAELGKWQLKDSVRAERVEKAGPDWWFCQVKIACSTIFTWRWAVITSDAQPVRWEERTERHTGVFYKPAVFHCAWNADDKSKLNEDIRALKK